MEGHVIFDDDYDLSHDNFVFTDSHQQKNKNKNNSNVLLGLVNPYEMYFRDVRPYHFRDARLYDPDITEQGWCIPSRTARQKYQRWLKSVRKNPGWETFRRRMCSILEEEEGVDQDGNIYTMFVKKLIPLTKLTDEEVWKRYNGDMIVRKLPVYEKKSIVSVPRNDSGQHKKNRALPQSRDKGVSIDDENFRPKMFTEKMGREISQIRSGLGLTQADLGKKINVDSNTIRNIEIGGIQTFNPEDSMVRALAKALGISSIKYQE